MIYPNRNEYESDTVILRQQVTEGQAVNSEEGLNLAGDKKRARPGFVQDAHGSCDFGIIA